MANRHKSAVKAHRQTEIRQAQNRELRSKFKTTLKAIRAALDTGDATQAQALLSETVSVIDKLAGKGIIHNNAADRHKSRLVRRVRAASA